MMAAPCPDNWRLIARFLHPVEIIPLRLVCKELLVVIPRPSETDDHPFCEAVRLSYTNIALALVFAHAPKMVRENRDFYPTMLPLKISGTWYRICAIDPTQVDLDVYIEAGKIEVNSYRLSREEQRLLLNDY